MLYICRNGIKIHTHTHNTPPKKSIWYRNSFGKNVDSSERKKHEQAHKQTYSHYGTVLRKREKNVGYRSTCV